MSSANMHRIEYTPRYIASFKKLPKEIKQKTLRKEKLFLVNPFDARLKTHKLHGVLSDHLSFLIDYRYRVMFRFIDAHSALFFDVGTHQLYQ